MGKIKDIGLQNKNSAEGLIKEFSAVGFQATHLAEAVELIEKMKKENCVIFLSFTANMVASGLRGIFRELCEKKFVDIIITTAGSIDHDVIKSFGSYELGSFNVDDAELYGKGLNRVGNIFVGNKHFELLEEKMHGWLKELHAREKIVSSRELNEFIGNKLGKSSFLHWCAKNKIPVY